MMPLLTQARDMQAQNARAVRGAGAVPATGAYCRSLANQYNHTPRPPVVAVRDGSARVIVRRERIEDILALDVDDPAPPQEAR